MKILLVARPAKLLAVIAVFAVWPGTTGATPTATPESRPELILSMPSDRWLDERPAQSGPTLADNREQNLIGSRKSRKSNVDVDCNMDLNQNTLGTAPLSERLGGNCEFGYHY
ncbi:hypothetical protein [Methylomonas koyamae]|uniref:hypothetical protein n=1 Tax=Methylomonas koyamae TaxID=702114 RepID=UPI0011265978|nr:hypothetical protein [Methylomonas koyamae]TPQ25817.1 hypothetical protein C2U68_14040 [Methylomonas koyamae]